MPLLNEILLNRKKTKPRSPKSIIVNTSTILNDVLTGKNEPLVSSIQRPISSLLIATFLMGELYVEAFEIRCRGPKNIKDLRKVSETYDYVSLMLSECGGALQNELKKKYGSSADGISQKLVEMAMRGDEKASEVQSKFLDMIKALEKEKNEQRE